MPLRGCGDRPNTCCASLNWRIRAAHFLRSKPGHLRLPSHSLAEQGALNKALVMELGRCEYIQRRENVIDVGTVAPARPMCPPAWAWPSASEVCPWASPPPPDWSTNSMEARDERHLLNLPEATVPSQPADHRRTGLRPTVPHRRGTALRGILPALRTWLDPGDHQPSLRRVD